LNIDDHHNVPGIHQIIIESVKKLE